MKPVLAQIKTEVRAPHSQAVVIQLAGAGLSFLVYLAIARLFGAAEVGHYAILVQTAVTAATVALFGRDQSAARAIAIAVAQERPASARAQLRAQGSRALVFLALAGGVVVLAAPLLRRVGIDERTALLAGPIVALYGTLRFASGALRGAGSVRAAQAVVALQPLVMLAAVGLLLGGAAETGAGLGWGYLVSLLVSATLAGLLLARSVKAWSRSTTASPEPLADKRMSYGFSIIATTVFGWALLAVLGLLLDRQAMGIYQVCLQLQLPFAMVMTTYVLSLTPELARLLERRDPAATRRFLRDRGRTLVAITFPALILMLVFAAPILRIFGEEFFAGADALRIFTLGTMATMLWGFAATVLYMAHRDGTYLALTLGSIAASVLVLVLLLPRAGLTGVAAGYMVQAVAMHGAAAWLARRAIHEA